MANRQIFPDPEQLRGEKILRDMERLKSRNRPCDVLGYLPWVVFGVLLLVIVVVAFSHWGGLSAYWQRLVRPDSIPGLSR